MNEEDYDLYYHALNYRTAASQHAEAAWQELVACHNRLLEKNERDAMNKNAEYPSMMMEAAYNALMNENSALQKKLDAAEERAEYGLKSFGFLEKAHQNELAKRDAMTALARELLVMLEKLPHGDYCMALCGPVNYGWTEETKCNCGRNKVIAKAGSMLK